MTTLERVAQYFSVSLQAKRLPIEIPNVGRGDLAILFCELCFRVGVEVGVESGHYSEMLCRRNPGVKLYGVDAWTAYSAYRDHVSQAKIDGFYETAVQRMAPYDFVPVRAFSVDAAAQFKKRPLDFVYIDANHSLPYVIADIAAWAPKVRKGGIVAGHDFIRRKNPSEGMHVVDAVNAWTSAYRITPWFVLGSKVIQPGDTRDQPRSWFWVNL